MRLLGPQLTDRKRLERQFSTKCMHSGSKLCMCKLQQQRQKQQQQRRAAGDPYKFSICGNCMKTRSEASKRCGVEKTNGAFGTFSARFISRNSVSLQFSKNFVRAPISVPSPHLFQSLVFQSRRVGNACDQELNKFVHCIYLCNPSSMDSLGQSLCYSLHIYFLIVDLIKKFKFNYFVLLGDLVFLVLSHNLSYSIIFYWFDKKFANSSFCFKSQKKSSNNEKQNIYLFILKCVLKKNLYFH